MNYKLITMVKMKILFVLCAFSISSALSAAEHVDLATLRAEADQSVRMLEKAKFEVQNESGVLVSELTSAKAQLRTVSAQTAQINEQAQRVINESNLYKNAAERARREAEYAQAAAESARADSNRLLEQNRAVLNEAQTAQQKTLEAKTQAEAFTTELDRTARTVAAQAEQTKAKAAETVLRCNEAEKRIGEVKTEFEHAKKEVTKLLDDKLYDKKRAFEDERREHQALIKAKDKEDAKALINAQARKNLLLEEKKQKGELEKQAKSQDFFKEMLPKVKDIVFEAGGAAAGFVSNPHKMLPTAVGVCGFAVAIYGARNGSAIVAEIAKRAIMTPNLVTETNVPTFFESIKNFVMGSVEEEVDFNRLILSADIKDRVMNVANSAKKITNFKDQFANVNYQNVCFYGPPGTGKTMAAKMLAGYAGMKYAYINGGDVAKLSKADAILQLQDIFKWARKSGEGLLLFVDEAESFLCNREGASEDLKQMVNAFIAECGTSSKQFMIATATNHVSSLDSAVRSRIEHFIPFDYPGAQERRSIINLYLKKFAFSEDGAKEVKINTDINLNAVVAKTESFSGRDLEKMVNDLVIQAQMNHDGVISDALCQKVATIWKEQLPTKRKMNAT